jgi:hypothetical protein
MAWDSDSGSANEDDLDSKPTDNQTVPGVKKAAPPFGGKTKVKGAKSFGKGFIKGIGTRKSTSAPRGEGRKGQTTKSNALKNA